MASLSREHGVQLLYGDRLKECYGRLLREGRRARCKKAKKCYQKLQGKLLRRATIKILLFDGRRLRPLHLSAPSVYLSAEGTLSRFSDKMNKNHVKYAQVAGATFTASCFRRLLSNDRRSSRTPVDTDLDDLWIPNNHEIPSEPFFRFRSNPSARALAIRLSRSTQKRAASYASTRNRRAHTTAIGVSKTTK